MPIIIVVKIVIPELLVQVQIRILIKTGQVIIEVIPLEAMYSRDLFHLLTNQCNIQFLPEEVHQADQDILLVHHIGVRRQVDQVVPPDLHTEVHHHQAGDQAIHQVHHHQVHLLVLLRLHLAAGASSTIIFSQISSFY